MHFAGLWNVYGLNPLNSPFTDNTLLSIILEQLLFDESKKNS